MSNLKSLNMIEFTTSVMSYIKRQFLDDVFKEIVKKFKRGGKEVAMLITREIMSSYDVQVYTHYKNDQNDPLMTVAFFPKRKFMHKK